MDISTLFSGLLSRSSADAPSEAGEREESASTVYECRTCGTNVSADQASCPACDGDDIVAYSID